MTNGILLHILPCRFKGEIKMKCSILKNTLVTLLSLVILTLTTKTSTLAEDIVFGFTPDGIYPVSQTDISLVSEEITITLIRKDYGMVNCRFDFKNNGEAQSVVMAVPARLNEKTTKWTLEEYLNIHNFSVFYEKIDGPVSVKLVDSIPNQPIKNHTNNQTKYSKWYTFTIEFDKNEELSVYTMYSIESFSFDNMYNMFISYTLESGALWEGQIEHAKVIFDIGYYPIYSVTDVFPNNLYRIEDKKLIWERSNFEPEYNLSITQNSNDYTDSNIAWLSKIGDTAGVKAIKERITFFDTSPQIIRDNKQKYLDQYVDFIHKDILKAIYIKSALDLPHGSENPKITDCRVLEHKGNTWCFEIEATDPDLDLIQCHAEVEGVDNYVYKNNFEMNSVSYNPENNQFISKCHLVVEEGNLFKIRFVVKDSIGNFDTKTFSIKKDDTISPLEEVSDTGNLLNNDTVALERDKCVSNEIAEVNHIATPKVPVPNVGTEIPVEEIGKVVLTEKTSPSYLIIKASLAFLICLVILLYLYVKLYKVKKTKNN